MEARLYAAWGVEIDSCVNMPNDLGVKCDVFRAVDVDCKATPFFNLKKINSEHASINAHLFFYCLILNLNS